MNLPGSISTQSLGALVVVIVALAGLGLLLLLLSPVLAAVRHPIRLLRRLLVLVAILGVLAFVGAERLAPMDFRWPEEGLPRLVNVRTVPRVRDIRASQVAAALRRAAGTWNRAASRVLLRASDRGVGLTAGDCGVGAAGSYNFRGWTPDGWPDGPETICINAARYHWSVNGRADALDLETVLLHELGHVLGLGDPPDVSCVVGYHRRVMCPGDNGRMVREPSEAEASAVRRAYQASRALGLSVVVTLRRSRFPAARVSPL